MNASKSEQIESLVIGNAFEFAQKQVGSSSFNSDSYAQVFTVTRSDIVNYLRDNYELRALALTIPGDADGFYAVAVGEGFQVYEQERKVRFMESRVRTLEEAWEKYADYLIRSSGTGLSFENGVN